MLTPFLSLRLRALSKEQLLEGAILTAILLAGVVAISPNLADPDLWGHVQYGRDFLRQGLPDKTTYSYVAQDQKWINHENLMEVGLALGADYLGPLGMIAAKMLGGLALLLFVLHFSRKQGCGLIVNSLIVLLTAVSLARYWSLRPQLFSFVAYALMLGLLQACFAGWEGRWQFARTKDADGPANLISSRPFHLRISWLWLVPLLMAAWTNAHGGFIAGCAIFSVYLFMRSCEAYWQAGQRAIGTIKRFAVWVGATLFATFLNPYGYDFHIWLLHDLGVPRPEITEWLPPNFADEQMFPFALLIATLALCLALSRRSWDATHLVVLAATLWQSLAHERHIPFFALSLAFFLPRHLQAVVARFTDWAAQRCSPAPEKPSSTSCFPGPVLLFPLLLTLGVLGWNLYERGRDLKVPRYLYPVSAVQFLADQRLEGRLLCTFNWSQYLLSVFAVDQAEHRLLVHVDGRCRTAYSQSMIDEHFDFVYGDQPASCRYREPQSSFDPLKALEHGQPNLVLIDRGQPHSVQIMQSQTHRWTLLYQDALAQVWGRRERYDDPESPDYLAPHKRRISDELQQGHVTWPALPVIHPES